MKFIKRFQFRVLPPDIPGQLNARAGPEELVCGETRSGIRQPDEATL